MAGSNAGRPTVMTEGAVALLTASLQNGLNITQACLQAGISRDAYYDRVKIDLEFSDKMTLAQEFGKMRSRQIIIDAINNEKDVATAKWYLERKDPEFKPKQDITSDDKRIGELTPETEAIFKNIFKDAPNQDTPAN